MVKGVSTLHAAIAFLWYFVFLVLSWIPLYTVIPIWYDQSDGNWTYIDSICNFFSFAGYCAYDLFYFVLVCRILYDQSVSTSKTLVEVGVRAIMHTLFSLVGIMLYSFNLPAGVLEQNIMIAAGIHFFLNWKYKYSKLMALAVCVKKKSRRLVFRTPPSDRKVAPMMSAQTVNFRPIAL